MSNYSINLTPALYQYLQVHSLREPEVLQQLRKETAKLSAGRMQISPEQGQLMALLLQLMQARRVLEIGTFTGYSALVMALALPADGRVVCCDRSAEWTQIAKDFWQQAGVTDKIQLILGEAKATLANLLTQGEQQTFDFVFIDADKTGYDHYYEVALELLRPGGLIAVDNVLWYGNVADPAIKDKDTQALRLFNQKLHQDSRISLAMIPIGDGLTLARKH